MKYVVISPVKDEVRHVKHTLESMLKQTTIPVRWIIVDDGSTDGTTELIESYCARCDFIELIQRPAGQARQPGGGVIRAFNVGLEAASRLDYEVIVKLDCDLSFEADYFETLLQKFSADPTLGIASGVYFESINGQPWSAVEMPNYHAAGASKMVRRSCFEKIGGFVTSRGWDTVDEIKAQSQGWKTTHFPEAKMKHWKPEGTGIGRWKTNIMHGEIYYLTGGGLSFFVLKVLRRMQSRPYGVGGLGLVWGYLGSRLAGKERLVTAMEAKHYRALLRARVAEGLMRRTDRTPHGSAAAQPPRVR